MIIFGYKNKDKFVNNDEFYKNIECFPEDKYQTKMIQVQNLSRSNKFDSVKSKQH